MAEAEDQNPTNFASHTLAYLRRIDRRQDQLVELATRQQDLISRLKRDMREGFALIQRDLREIKGDIMILENKLFNRMSAELDLSRRLERIEERFAIETDDRTSPSVP